MTRTIFAAAFALATAAPMVAHADDVTFVRGQFAARVERGQPAGDAAEAQAARPLVYWVEVRNAGAPAQITLVWNVNGRVFQRQTLDVGRGRWRTWGFFPQRAAGRTVEVTVLDAAGATLHTDRLGGAAQQGPVTP